MNNHKCNSVAIFLALILALSMGSFIMIPTKAASVDPAITLLPPAAPVGTPIAVNGTNFAPGATVDLYWFGYIVDVPGSAGHVGYYVIKAGITVGSDGSFVTTFLAPYDFSDIYHFVNATQNGVGTGITNATFTIMPTLSLSPQPANYTDGQQVFLSVYGAPLGTAAFMMGLNPQNETTVLKLTYDNTMWGFVTSHLVTEGPIVTAGFTGGDIGGNATVRFNAVGEIGQHIIRGYVGAKDTPTYLPCEIGGQATFTIVGPSSDAQTILSHLNDDVASIQTNLGNVTSSNDAIKGSEDNLINYGIGALALSTVSLIILFAVVVQVFRKPKQLQQARAT